mmetsp:Transcript_42745/g.89300  ORF Transcript_42745/g.89300 Transcript_42745/m.89300 type:complete len:232 (+) Transcript_42745:406-1101(+)
MAGRRAFIRRASVFARPRRQSFSPRRRRLHRLMNSLTRPLQVQHLLLRLSSCRRQHRPLHEYLPGQSGVISIESFERAALLLRKNTAWHSRPRGAASGMGGASTRSSSSPRTTRRSMRRSSNSVRRLARTACAACAATGGSTARWARKSAWTSCAPSPPPSCRRCSSHRQAPVVWVSTCRPPTSCCCSTPSGALRWSGRHSNACGASARRTPLSTSTISGRAARSRSGWRR